MANRSDDFNRADSATSLGTPSDGGSAWVANAGTWGISSNKAYEAGVVAHDTATLDASAADVEVQATVSGTGGGTDAGLVARLTDNSNYILLVIVSGSVLLYRVQSGGFNLLGSAGVTLANGDVFKLSCSGSAVNAYQNGVLRVGPITESFNNTATKHGLRGHGDTAFRWDDFGITDLGGGGAAGHPAMRRLGGVGGARTVEIGREGVRVYRAFPADLRRWGRENAVLLRALKA